MAVGALNVISSVIAVLSIVMCINVTQHQPLKYANDTSIIITVSCSEAWGGMGAFVSGGTLQGSISDLGISCTIHKYKNDLIYSQRL